MNQGAVLVFGEALADLVPEDEHGERYQSVLGGSGFNTALALARCGGAVAYCATLSRDITGRRFQVRLVAEGIDQRFIADSDAPTALAVVAPLGADGGARYHFHLAGTALAEPPPLPGSLTGFGHLHVTSFGATIGPSGDAALALLRQARSAGLSTSYDLNIRPPALPEREAALAAIEQRMALSDLIRLSTDDADWLYPGSYAAPLRRWFDRGVSSILLTEGDRGAILERAGGKIIRGFVPVTELVDTIGAGDSFIGAFLASLAQAGELGARLRGLSDGAAASAMDFAAQVAAETCGRRGCDPPRLTPKPPYE